MNFYTTLAAWSVLPWTPAASDQAHRIDILMAALTAFCLAVVGLVAILVLWFCLKYRAGSAALRPPAPGRHTTWSRALESSLLAVIFVVFIAMGAWAGVEFARAETINLQADPIYIVGKQWMWKAEHPSGRREINELHIPVGEPVRLIMGSQDVIHSFYVPAFRMKQDVVPGRFTSESFTPTRPGDYHLFCAEYCGAEHSGMHGTIHVMEPADFARWLSDRSDVPKAPGMPGTDEAPLKLGRALFFKLGCATCHMRTAQGSVLAPRLDGLWGRTTKLNTDRLITVDENYIRESILDPNAKIVAGYAQPSLMPSFRGQVSEDDLRELVEFIRSIRYGWPDELGTPAVAPLDESPPASSKPSDPAPPITPPPSDPSRFPSTAPGPSRTEARP